MIVELGHFALILALLVAVFQSLHLSHRERSARHAKQCPLGEGVKR